jgi:hypothetical protein
MPITLTTVTTIIMAIYVFSNDASVSWVGLASVCGAKLKPA